MYRKIIFIFFSILTTLKNEKKTVFLLFLCGFSLFFTKVIGPFKKRELNILEVQSNLTATVTIFAGSLYILDISDYSKAMVFVLIVLINSIFVMKWLLSVFNILMDSYANKIGKICPCILFIYMIMKKTAISTRRSINFPKYMWNITKRFMVSKKNLN